MTGSNSATMAHFPVAVPSGDTLSLMMGDRERLTLLLRGLASDLDEVERRLADIAWRERCTDPAAHADERTSLMARRTHLDSRLRVMALKLNGLDSALSSLKGFPDGPATRVGTCPDCGYPSLDSGLCAYCRP